eukprot:6460430-Amphidinium_carterae.3
MPPRWKELRSNLPYKETSKVNRDVVVAPSTPVPPIQTGSANLPWYGAWSLAKEAASLALVRSGPHCTSKRLVNAWIVQQPLLVAWAVRGAVSAVVSQSPVVVTLADPTVFCVMVRRKAVDTGDMDDKVVWLSAMYAQTLFGAWGSVRV